MRIEQNVLQQVEKIVKIHFEAHKRYGESTRETEMRFKDILSEINQLFVKLGLSEVKN